VVVRTQIQITEIQSRWLRTVAQREGVSMAEILRRCIDLAQSSLELRRADCYARAAELVGTFCDSGNATDVALHHDQYLEEAFE